MPNKFCLDGFWNLTLFKNQQYPIFTECFQYTLLLIPTGIFSLMFIFFLVFKKYKSQPIIKLPIDFWYILKLIMPIFMVILLILEICFDRFLLKTNLELDGIYILSYALLIFTMFLVILQTEIRRRTMHPVCLIIFIFWFTNTLTYLLRFYSNIIRIDLKNYYSDIKISFLVVSGLIFTISLLHLIIECFSRYSPERLLVRNKRPCPAEYSSILSQITYSWLNKYIYSWYKKEITDETAFELRRQDESTKNINAVERVFLAKIKQRKIHESNCENPNVTSSTTNLLSEEQIDNSGKKINAGWILFTSLFKIFSFDIFIAWTFKIIHDIFIFANPFLLKILLQYIQEKSNSYWIGYSLAFAFLFAGIISSLTENLSFFITSNISIRVRAVIIGIVYRKTLRLNNEARSTSTSGEIVNLMSVDAERLMNWIVFSWFIVSCPLQIILAILLLYQEMSYSIFAGLGLIIAFFPINGFLMNFMQKYSVEELSWKDKRVKILTEILNGIKVLKMYAWEKSFLSKVTDLRNTEMKYILRVSVGWGLVSVVWEILPFLVMLVTFLTYVFSDIKNVITAEKAFVSLTLFNLMRFPMVVLPWGLTESINAFVSVKRIGEYLVGEELDKTGIYHLDDPTDTNYDDISVVEIRDGSFSWKKDDKVILNNINLEIHKGKLIAIVGKVGTGKSSLISAILGEMHRLSGSVKIQGKMAYVPQEAWIQNKSVKENILFTENYNETLYNKILEACSLLPDLDQLPGRDETEIGERGINLSGGQKQRISLARSVYQNRDIYLLDDPLSAVDAHVGQHLFEHVISNNGILRGKTRILVTHGLNWLPKVDEVFVLDSNGTISERGSFKELLKNGDVFMQFVQEYIEHNNRNADNNIHEDDDNISKAQLLLKQVSGNNDAVEEFTDLVLVSPPKTMPVAINRSESRTSEQRVSVSSRRSSDIVPFALKFDKKLETSNSDYLTDEDAFHTSSSKRRSSKERNYIDDKRASLGTSQSAPIGQLIDEELAMSGTVKWATYALYIKSRGILVFILTILVYIVYTGLQVYNNMWLQQFTNDPIILNASAEIQKHSSISLEMSKIIREKTQHYMLVYGLIGIGMTITVCFYWLGFTIGTVNASKVIHKSLLHRILRGSIEFFDTTPSGRILNRFSKDIETLDHILPMNISDGINCFFLVLASIIVIIYVTPWFAVVILPLGGIYYLILLLYMPTSRQSRRLDSIASSPVFNNFTETIQGVALIRAFREEKYFKKLNQSLIDRSNKFKFIQLASVRWLSFRIDTLGNIIIFASVLFAIIDRKYLSASLAGLSISYSLQITEFLNWLLRQYTDLETNAVAMERIREYSMINSEAEWDLDNNLPETWPNAGNVTFENYNLRYREGLPLVLKNINLHLNGGDRIGIVGRTGAGKSSLNLALFRLVEPAGGSIKIDEVDISKLGLHDLRKNLTVLPQDPVIFSGTLRDNLDPFSKHTEDELFQTLETAHLKQWVSTLTEGIDYECGEGGANLSAGQKQLLCLARALLRKSKVLILDEATASVDVETDRLVMQTIREYFRFSTVIIIAHRINTILDTDKIIVMENGQVVEMDSPANLMAIPNGIFKSLHDQSLKHDL